MTSSLFGATVRLEECVRFLIAVDRTAGDTEALGIGALGLLDDGGKGDAPASLLQRVDAAFNEIDRALPADLVDFLLQPGRWRLVFG